MVNVSLDFRSHHVYSVLSCSIIEKSFSFPSIEVTCVSDNESRSWF